MCVRVVVTVLAVCVCVTGGHCELVTVLAVCVSLEDTVVTVLAVCVTGGHCELVMY